MLAKIQIIILLLFQIKNFSVSFDNLLCSAKFCKDYLEKQKCKNLGAACRIQNQTFNGKILPEPIPCNCCQTCVQNLREGDLCTKGGIGIAPPNVACGPGLICTADENNPEDHRCRKMHHTNCLEDQVKYDTQKNSTTGIGLFVQRPNCDTDAGFYKSIKCNLGQMCFCVDKNGKRIFGEAPYHSTIEKTMNCECSRLNLDFNEFMNFGKNSYHLSTAKCSEDGSYDPLQCMGDTCNCVKRDGSLRFWSSFDVNNSTYDKIPCFNNAIHSKYNYLHNCEMKQWYLINQLKESEKNGYIVINFEIPSCQPDGWFLPIQQNETALFCVDKYGRKIDNFEILKTSIESKNMNCNCARTRNILIQNLGRIKSDDILPQCCSNGNFKKVQCRGDICYCSDENGLQIGVEKHLTNITSLECYNGRSFC